METNKGAEAPRKATAKHVQSSGSGGVVTKPLDRPAGRPAVRPATKKSPEAEADMAEIERLLKISNLDSRERRIIENELPGLRSAGKLTRAFVQALCSRSETVTPYGLPTGLAAMDKGVGGISRIFLVTGAPGHMKTTTALNIMSHRLAQGDTVVYVDFENGAERVAPLLVSLAKLLRLSEHMKNEGYLAKYGDLFRRSIEFLRVVEQRLVYRDHRHMEALGYDMDQRTFEACCLGRAVNCSDPYPDLVCIDSLNKLPAPSSTLNNRRLVVDRYMGYCEAITQASPRTHFLVIVELRKSQNKVPDMMDLKESYGLSYAAWTILHIEKHEEQKGKDGKRYIPITFHPVKCRQMACPKPFRVSFSVENGCFQENAPQEALGLARPSDPIDKIAHILNGPDLDITPNIVLPSFWTRTGGNTADLL